MEKEYGGYIEYEHYSGAEYHSGMVTLNCGRNCLAAIILKRNIKKIYIPYFLCESVREVCEKINCIVEFYHIDEQFYPIIDFTVAEDEYLYVVNYYGQIEKAYLKKLKERYTNVIVDNAQAFFENPLDDTDTIYVPRKYFGVPDGAYVSTKWIDEMQYPIDISKDRIDFLVGRFEVNASDFYEHYKKVEGDFKDEPIKRMSLLTHNLLRAINYEEVKKKREDNFDHLCQELGQFNLLEVKKTYGPFAYPFLVKKGNVLKQKMRKRKIYIPTLWPNVLSDCDCDSVEYRHAENILPIPVDQRYTIEDMSYIVSSIKELL